MSQEELTEEWKIFNAHQEDVRRRADSLCRAVFVLDGGTLTVSIGIFTRASAPELPQSLSLALMGSWWFLFASIICGAIALFVIILRDYLLGERWRKKLLGHDEDASGEPGTFDSVIWAVGVLCIVGFIIGMLGQAYVATSLL